MAVFAVFLIAFGTPGFEASGRIKGRPVGGEMSNNLSLPSIQTASASTIDAIGRFRPSRNWACTIRRVAMWPRAVGSSVNRIHPIHYTTEQRIGIENSIASLSPKERRTTAESSCRN